ncbi:MAG: hypothetical protein RMI79_02700 [Nitrososphaerota archaeon]|nr:hypothetical protein [Nitrososphaerota archaeon]
MEKEVLKMGAEQSIPISKYIIKLEFTVEGVVERIFVLEGSHRNMM